MPSSLSDATQHRLAVATVSALLTLTFGCHLYFSWRQAQTGVTAGASLHRSNAVRRSQQRPAEQEAAPSETNDRNENDTGEAEAESEFEAGGESEEQNTNDEYDGNDDSPGHGRTRSGENIVQLLFRVSEENARLKSSVHRGCQCNGCGMVPIRGIRYRCANCADFDLCDMCESQGLHDKTHVFYKVRVPAPPFVPRQVQPSWYSGDPDNIHRVLPKPLLAKWSQETGLERLDLDSLWEQWIYMANTEWREDPSGLGLAMDRKTFERCLVPSAGYRHAAPNLIHDRMFAFYDTNGDDLIGFEEFLHGVVYRRRKDKLRRTFEGYDLDGDGYVNRRDFLRMFRAYYVLYKQMHRDILDGHDEHMMTTAEAHQLVHSRAPLSSHFGREGRVPAGDNSRPMEGKVFHGSGDVYVTDGKTGVVNDDKPDTSSRQDILLRLFTRNPSHFTESFSAPPGQPRSADAGRYLSGLIDPPRNMADMEALINHHPDIEGSVDYHRDHHQLGNMGEATVRPQERLDSARAQRSGNAGSEPPDHGNQSAGEEAGSDAEGGQAPGAGEEHSSDAGLPSPLRGATFPSDLDADPPRDELRFETDDYAAQTLRRTGLLRRADHRSKRVQARRRLLDRWKRRQFYLDEEEGGQAPQDWKPDEDVLAKANETFKPLPPLLSPRSRSSSKVRFAEDTDDFDIRSNPSTSSSRVPERWGGMDVPDAERDAGKEILYQVTQQAFNELLDDIFKEKEDLAIQCAETKDLREKYRHLYTQLDEEGESSTLPPRGPSPAAQSPCLGANEDGGLDEVLPASGLVDAQSDDSSHRPGGDAPELSASKAGEDGQRDPTMPQFRPNRLPESAQQNVAIATSDAETAVFAPASVTESGKATSSKVETKAPAQPPVEITKGMLAKWKRLDLAEQEARERGGWGRLTYPEFEEMYKKHEFADSSRNRLDYLGSWIDFCIP